MRNHTASNRELHHSRHLVATAALMTALFALLVNHPAIGMGDAVVGGTVSSASRGFPSVVILEPASPADVPVSSKPVRIDQVEKTFTPGVVAARLGQVVEFHNGESLLHNIHLLSDNSGKTVLNVAMPIIGMVRSFTPEEPGVYVVLCDVHPEMEAYIVVTDSPYYTVAAEDGSFSLPQVPEGSYLLRVWNVKGARSGEKQVQITGTTTEITLDR